MSWRKIDTTKIPWSDYVEEPFHENGSTEDIMAGLLEGDSEHDTRFNEFAKQFSKDRKGLQLLWSFVRNAIKFVEDPFGVQNIKLAAALWKVRKGDCKSKTIFTNQILKCLGIPYITRFIGYDRKRITHVYSIAFLNGNPIILDSVYNYFDAEPKHNLEKDFNMTKINIIRGIPKVGTAEADETYYQAKEAAHNRYEEIQQRKQYVQPKAPINFAKVSEGEALLELLIRKLEIIGTMKDEQKATTEKGIGLIRNSIKTGKVMGSIPDELQGVAARINHYLSLNGSAVGHGYRGRALDAKKIKARSSDSFIGSQQGIQCLAQLWWHEVGGSGTVIDPYAYQQFPALCYSSTLRDLSGLGSQNYFFYGRNTTKYRTSYAESQQVFEDIINKVDTWYPNSMRRVADLTYNFASQGFYDVLIEQLKQGMPVLSNWANDLYRADNTRTDGTIGTGLLYNFVPDLTQIAGISPGNFPSIVQTKMIFQQQYMDSCVNFSTISRSIFEEMAENGILFDNGGESPKRVLSALLKNHNPNVGLAATTVTLIIGIVTAVLSTVTTIAANANKGADDASKIDSSAKDTAEYKNQSQSTMPNMSDFDPLVQTGGGGGNNNNNSGGGSGGGNNNNGTDKKSSIVPVAAVAAAAYAYSKRKNKN